MRNTLAAVAVGSLMGIAGGAVVGTWLTSPMPGAPTTVIATPTTPAPSASPTDEWAPCEYERAMMNDPDYEGVTFPEEWLACKD